MSRFNQQTLYTNLCNFGVSSILVEAFLPDEDNVSRSLLAMDPRLNYNALCEHLEKISNPRNENLVDLDFTTFQATARVGLSGHI